MTLADSTGSVGVRQAAIITALIHVVWGTKYMMVAEIIHPAIIFGPSKRATLFQ